jgi:hypothetical protein
VAKATKRVKRAANSFLKLVKIVLIAKIIPVDCSTKTTICSDNKD